MHQSTLFYPIERIKKKKKPFAKENRWKCGMSLVTSSKAIWTHPGELAILLPPWRITEAS